MTRKECLDKAAECVLQDRASQYGRPEDNFGRIAKLWSTYTGTVLDGIDVAMMMSLLKVARIRNNKDYSDGYIDLAGYAACGAELAGRAEAYRQSIEAAGEEYKKLRGQAEGGCCQNGKDHSPEEPEFKPGDAVEWNSVGGEWRPAVYLREFGDFGHCVVQLPDGRERIVSKADLRRPEANHPDFPDSSTAAEPGFKPGDHLILTYPNGDERSCVYVGESLGETAFCLVRYDDDGTTDDVPVDELRRVPRRAEGCEDLVQKDAPQTAQELYKRIIANNPATFKARTPTGEELAEMAEEEKRG
jgi:hypothetical protein